MRRQHEQELLEIYPPGVVEFQKQLEYTFPHFTSLVIDQLEEHSTQDMCSVDSFMEMVKVLRDKYLFYLGRQELVLQGGIKPKLPDNLDAPPKIIIELIDYSQLTDPASEVKFGAPQCGSPYLSPVINTTHALLP